MLNPAVLVVSAAHEVLAGLVPPRLSLVASEVWHDEEEVEGEEDHGDNHPLQRERPEQKVLVSTLPSRPVQQNLDFVLLRLQHLFIYQTLPLPQLLPLIIPQRSPWLIILLTGRIHQYNIDLSNNRQMPNNSCLGCRTYFEEGERVPLQSMFIQFKNYYLPLKESKQKWILLKTITGFLNSKGGTIYIGVEDKKGEVMGLELSRKEQDQFLLFIKVFVEKIRPAVDLVNKQEVSIVYVPVVTNKVFKGKYVIKIIVRQGDPSKTYHFSNVIAIESKGKLEEFEIFHAFYRHNMGGIVEIRGEPLLQEIARKAEKPNEVSITFHKFCNPDPLKLDGTLTKIGFSGIRKQQLRNRLQQIFHNNLQNFDVEYELTYDIQNQVLLIELENQEQFKKINKYMKQNLAVLNQTGEFNFVEKGEYLDFYLYRNMHVEREVSAKNGRQESPSPISQGHPNIEEKSKVQVKKQEEETQVWDYVAGDSEKEDISLPKQPKKSENLGEKANSKEKEMCQKALDKEFVLTITHINTEKRDDFESYLKELMGDKYIAKFDKYIRTIELKFESRENVRQFYDLLQKNNQKVSQFGARENIVIGINMKLIRISNYDRNKRKELKVFISNKLGGDIEEIQFKKSNNKFFLQCKFKTRQLTCSWLDKLLVDNQMKKFMIPGSDNKGRLRIYIYCICN